jgi:hypothetical protein
MDNEFLPLQIINDLPNDCLGNNPLQSNLFHSLIILDSPALRKINYLFNITERIIIYRSHHTVIPSSSHNDPSIGLQDHIRRNHSHLNQHRDFFTKLLTFLPSILTARDLVIQRYTQGNESLINGISTHEDFQCRRYNACGPKKYIQDHVTRIHKGSFATLATPVMLQQYDLNGVYSPVRATTNFAFPSPAWESLYDSMMNSNTSEDIRDEGRAISAFLKNAGWVDCVKGKETEFAVLTAIDQGDGLSSRILKFMKNYLQVTNTEISKTNTTLRRWMESRGYVISLFSLIPN